jgi:hypothetical protein
MAIRIQKASNANYYAVHKNGMATFSIHEILKY